MIYREEFIFMDYELMMNGNVKIGQKAPEFEAVTTFGTIKLEDYKNQNKLFLIYFYLIL